MTPNDNKCKNAQFFKEFIKNNKIKILELCYEVF